jgi:hypothetical protein
MLTREEVLGYLKDNQTFFKQKFHLIKIGLFGSFARNEQNENSDIDLLIELDSEVDNVHQLKNEFREFISMHLHRNVDLAREKYLKSYAREYIYKEVIFV